MIDIFFKGVVIGFLSAVPVGPIMVLCVCRTIRNGLWSGLASGLGIAVMDATYGFLAGAGLTLLTQNIVIEKFWLRLVGGLILVALGIHTYRKKISKERSIVTGAHLLGDFVSTFFLTAMNFQLLLVFGAVYAGLGFQGEEMNYKIAADFALGIFLGSLIWAVTANLGMHQLRHRFSHQTLQMINRVAAGLLIGFGFVALVSLL